MNTCNKVLINYINEFINLYNESILSKILSILFLVTMVVTISVGTFTLLDGKYFNEWGWVIFTIGCLLLMFFVVMSFLYCFCEFINLCENKETNNTIITSNTLSKNISSGNINSEKKFKKNNLISEKKFKKKILTSERIDIV